MLEERDLLRSEKEQWESGGTIRDYELRIQALEENIRRLKKNLEQEKSRKSGGDFDNIVSLYEGQIKGLQEELASVQKQKTGGSFDPVQLLALSGKSLTPAILKRRMRELKRLHPDKSGKECKGVFKAVMEAERSIRAAKGWD